MYGSNLKRDGNYFYSAEHLCWRDYRAHYKHSFLEPSSLHGKMCSVGPHMHQFSCLKGQRGSDMGIELNQSGDTHQLYTRCFSKHWPNKCHLLEHTTSQRVAVTQEFSRLFGERPRVPGSALDCGSRRPAGLKQALAPTELKFWLRDLIIIKEETTGW